MGARVIQTIDEMRQEVSDANRDGLSIGLVPTMGALHAGHMALIERARRENDRVAVSIFVNPAQFNQPEDFEKYPRSLDDDLAACSQAGVDWVFSPSKQEMYPENGLAFVDVETIPKGLCGANRPGHFRGVAVVVAKLFHIIPADRAYFGEKDYQQLAVIRRMVRDLSFAVKIVGVEIVREPDGLALSSRNSRLSPEERAAALALWRALSETRRRAQAGESDVRELREAGWSVLDAEPLAKPEYFEIVESGTMQPVERITNNARAVCAAWIGAVRLIDNAALGLAGAAAQ